MTYRMIGDCSIYNKMNNKIAEEHLDLEGEYSLDPVARTKLVWKAQLMMKRKYLRSRVEFGKLNFYSKVGREFVDMSERAF